MILKKDIEIAIMLMMNIKRLDEKNNYRGIPIEIKKNIFIELKEIN